LFLFLRTCHRPFSLRLLNNNKKTAPDRLPPRRMELAHFRAENGANISLEKWGSRVEEPSKFHLQEYFVYQKSTLRKWTRVDPFVGPTGFSCFLMNQENSDRPDSVCVRKTILSHIAYPLGAFSSQPTRSGHLQCTVLPLSLSLLPPPPPLIGPHNLVGPHRRHHPSPFMC